MEGWNRKSSPAGFPGWKEGQKNSVPSVCRMDKEEREALYLFPLSGPERGLGG